MVHTGLVIKITDYALAKPLELIALYNTVQKIDWTGAY